MKCKSCSIESNKGTKFPCPKCRKEIFRCEKCKALSIEYKCHCGYIGP